MKLWKPSHSRIFCLNSALAATLVLLGCGQSGSDPTEPSSGLVTLSAPIADDEGNVTFTEVEGYPKSAMLDPVAEPSGSERQPFVREQDRMNGGPVRTVSAEAVVENPATPESILEEIAQLRATPNDVIRNPIAGKPGQFEEIKLQPNQIDAEQTRRLQKIVELAMEVIGKTFQDQTQEQYFSSAVVYLAETRLQLALKGDESQAALMAEDAEALFKRDESSFAAVESSFKLLQLTGAKAQEHGDEAQWSVAFARQARMFAERFPQETSRVTVGLTKSGQQCDALGLTDEARRCYEILVQRYPEAPFAQVATAALRRFDLVGKPLTNFGGPSPGGGVVQADELIGKPTLVVFWSGDSQEFAAALPQLRAVTQTVGSDRMNVVAVNMDGNQQSMSQLASSGNAFATHHIFFDAAQLQGARNPFEQFYGLTHVPSMWLVDAQGVVRNVHVDINELGEQLAAVISE
ncbi:MAG: redoxin domain-containing protein [Planctomycetaceae bacterium]|nr:redoxin domain-containing protein [Planctomycetaceae bacterium]